jgi:hypothetical protein
MNQISPLQTHILTYILFISFNFRKRKSSPPIKTEETDEEDDKHVGKKKPTTGKDFKIPKKKAATPAGSSNQTPSELNPLASPEKKFEQVEDALEAMFADFSGTL